MSRLRAAVAALLFLGAAVSGRAQHAIRWLHEPSAAVEVDGLDADTRASLGATRLDSAHWVLVLAVYAEQPDTAGPHPLTPAVAGTWRMANGRLRFEPRFPFVPGVRYRAEFRPASLPGAEGTSRGRHGTERSDDRAAPIVSYFELPRADATPVTRVVRVHPTGGLLPENQLKFYVQFSGPMSRGGSYEHIQLRGPSGELIELPFLELDEELWDPAMTRLTLLIDPGRIKRGVKPLEDIGPVFESGKTYTLAIRPTWRDAASRPLKAGFEKAFRVGPADRTPPDPARWSFESLPAAGTSDPLVVRFDEPLDPALAVRLITVRRITPKLDPESPGAVLGEAGIGEEERRWVFQPAKSWEAGGYRLVVRTTIEDLAGNNIGKTFDVELATGGRRQLAAATVDVPFELK